MQVAGHSLRRTWPSGWLSLTMMTGQLALTLVPGPAATGSSRARGGTGLGQQVCEVDGPQAPGGSLCPGLHSRPQRRLLRALRSRKLILALHCLAV